MFLILKILSFFEIPTPPFISHLRVNEILLSLGASLWRISLPLMEKQRLYLLNTTETEDKLRFNSIQSSERDLIVCVRFKIINATSLKQYISAYI